MSGITLDDIQASFNSIKISDGTNDLLIDASGHLSINDGGNSITVDGAVSVSATDLDIRDLTHVSDSVKLGDGTDFVEVNADGSLNITDNGGSITVDDGGTPLSVSATDLDIRDLTHVSDSVKIGDGTDFLAVNADGSINAQTIPDAYDTWKTSVVSASTTATEIASTPLSNRLNMLIQNLGNADIYIAESNAVTSSNGVKVPKGGSAEFLFGAGSDVWCITSAGTADLRIAEFAA